MKYLLKGLMNKNYNDFFLFIEDITKEGLIVNYNTRVERIEDIALDNEILYSNTTLTYEEGVEGIIEFCKEENIIFPLNVLQHISSKFYRSNDFEFYAK